MTKFDFEDVYDTRSWVVLYENAQGYQKKFLEFCNDYALRAEFPNLDVQFEDHISGGFFNKERTQVLAVTFNKSFFKKLGIFFRAQQFGNVLYYSLLKTVERGIWDKVRSRDSIEKLIEIGNKCKNEAQMEELLSLFHLGNLIFVNAMKELDPDFVETNKLLKCIDHRK